MPPLPESLPAPDGVPTDVDAELAHPDEDRWHVRSPQQAEWVMRKLAHARRNLGAYDDMLATYQDQLADWHAKATRSDRRTAEWAEATLVAWALAERQADPDARTQQLPSGTVATRLVPPRPEVLDAPTVASALAHGHHPAFEDVVHVETKVDARRLASITQAADEWAIPLTCGCTPHVWQLGADLGVTIGQDWPVAFGQHGPACLGPEGAKVTGVERRRVGYPVSVIDGPEGGLRVVPIEGARMTEGRVSATVTMR